MRKKNNPWRKFSMKKSPRKGARDYVDIVSIAKRNAFRNCQKDLFNPNLPRPKEVMDNETLSNM